MSGSHREYMDTFRISSLLNTGSILVRLVATFSAVENGGIVADRCFVKETDSLQTSPNCEQKRKFLRSLFVPTPLKQSRPI